MKKILAVTLGLVAMISVSGCHSVVNHHRRHNPRPHHHPHEIVPQEQATNLSMEQTG